MINVHASLLPRWRGAAPVHRAILSGDETTGVTIMRVVLALDAGPMLDRTEVAIGPDETSGELERRLSDEGARLLVDVVNRLSRGAVVETAQDETKVTYAHRLERQERRIDWDRPAAAVHNAVRGLQPWPQAAVMFRERRVLLRRSRLGTAEPEVGALAPGAVVAVGPDAIEVAAAPGTGTVGLLELQVEGKAAQSARAFQAGYRVAVGDRFERLPADGA
jgi:methionyl-tRNA formyltransferase